MIRSIKYLFKDPLKDYTVGSKWKINEDPFCFTVATILAFARGKDNKLYVKYDKYDGSTHATYSRRFSYFYRIYTIKIK